MAEVAGVGARRGACHDPHSKGSKAQMQKRPQIKDQIRSDRVPHHAHAGLALVAHELRHRRHHPLKRPQAAAHQLQVAARGVGYMGGGSRWGEGWGVCGQLLILIPRMLCEWGHTSTKTCNA